MGTTTPSSSPFAFQAEGGEPEETPDLPLQLSLPMLLGPMN